MAPHVGEQRQTPRWPAGGHTDHRVYQFHQICLKHCVVTAMVDLIQVITISGLLDIPNFPLVAEVLILMLYRVLFQYCHLHPIESDLAQSIFCALSGLSTITMAVEWWLTTLSVH